MGRNTVPAFPRFAGAQLAGKLLPGRPESQELLVRAGQGGSCCRYHKVTAKATQGCCTGSKQGRGTPGSAPVGGTVPTQFPRFCNVLYGDSSTLCWSCCFWQQLLQVIHSLPFPKAVFWGAEWTLCIALVTARDSTCWCCFKLHCSGPQPSPWSSRFPPEL